MAFNSYPAQVRFDNEGESIVYGYMIDQFPDDLDVYCNLEWIDQNDRREIDFLVVVPNRGLVILEVKGGKVEAYGNAWRQFDRKSSSWHQLSLSYQLSRQQSVLKEALRPMFGNKFPKIAKLVVTPESNFSYHLPLPDMDRKMLVAKNDIDSLYEIIIRTLDEIEINRNFDSTSQALVRDVLAKVEPDYASLVATSERRGQVIDDLSREQIFILELLEDNPRILVTGGPGTGKTVLAIEDASEFAKYDYRTGLVCYNRGLVEVMNREVNRLEPEAQPVFVGNLTDNLGAFWNVEFPPVPDDPIQRNQHYETVIPSLLLERAQSLSKDEKFDAWIIDEAQDFNSVHWEIFRASLRDPDYGFIHLFGDTNQNLFQGNEATEESQYINTPWNYAVVRLKHNFRSTRNIAHALNAFYDIDERATGLVMGEQPQIHFVEKQFDVLPAVEDLVNSLITDYRWNPGDIAVVTTRKLHPKHLEQREQSLEGYWNRYFDQNEVFYTHVSSFKGLERPIVIVAVDGIPQSADGKRQIYVAASRARDDLIIIGTRDDLAEIGNASSEFVTNESDDNLS